MRATLAYTSARIVLLVVSVVLLYLAGARGLLLLALAFVVSGIASFVLPLGYSFNLDGTTIYLSLATLFLAQVFGVELSGSQILTIIGILMVTSKGAAPPARCRAPAFRDASPLPPSRFRCSCRRGSAN